MITIPKKLFYAIEAVLYIAYNAPEGPISSKEIAEKQGLPPRYLEQLMQKLVRAGVLRGVRGPRGGYLLAKEKRRISVADICELLDENEASAPEAGTVIGKQVAAPMWQEARQELMEKMGKVTVADLCERAEGISVPRQAAGATADFSI